MTTKAELLNAAKSKGINFEEKALIICGNTNDFALLEFVEYELTIAYLNGIEKGQLLSAQIIESEITKTPKLKAKKRVSNKRIRSNKARK